MNMLIDLFDNQEQALKEFAEFLKMKDLVLCKKVTPDLPETPVIQGPIAELKAALTAWTKHRHVRVYYSDKELRRNIEALIQHYNAQSITIWENIPSAVRNSIEALAIEVEDKLFICKFWRIWKDENGNWIHYYMEDYESYNSSDAEMVGWEIQQFSAFKL